MMRFTPAYAGKIFVLAIINLISEVHPRIRGEDLITTARPWCRAGSPPHTRGRFLSDKSLSYDTGFTPAYAGKI